MATDRGLPTISSAQPGRGDGFRSSLEQRRGLAAHEEGTVGWSAFRLDDMTDGTVDTFASEEGREAHVKDQPPAALQDVDPHLLAEPADIEPMVVVARPGSAVPFVP